MGFAQVTLVMDNTEPHLPNLRRERRSAVTRRYYRSGESEVLHQPASPCGSGTSTSCSWTPAWAARAIPSSDRARSTRSCPSRAAERREVFEEAAGISKYRHRKEEAERKLERTEENLVRINDKIAELELQVEPLRAQAETAQKYLVLRDELRMLEISVWLEQLAQSCDAKRLQAAGGLRQPAAQKA